MNWPRNNAEHVQLSPPPREKNEVKTDRRSRLFYPLRVTITETTMMKAADSAVAAAVTVMMRACVVVVVFVGGGW